MNVAKLVEEQIRWIEEHGGNLEGYVKRYGSKDEHDHYGQGGEAIYEADVRALEELVLRLVHES